MSGKSIFRKLLSALRDPRYVASVATALARGAYYIVFFRLFRRDVRIGFPFKAFAKVVITGPGSVQIGKGCSVLPNVFDGLTIVTLDPAAEVVIGDNGHLGGLTIRCRGTVRVGDKIMTAQSLVQDAPFLHEGQGGGEHASPRPVSIGSNVWLGGHSIILGGSTVGKDSVIGACSVCDGSVVEDYYLGLGNPISRGMPIERLLKLTGAA